MHASHSNKHILFFVHLADTLESMGGRVGVEYSELISGIEVFAQLRETLF